MTPLKGVWVSLKSQLHFSKNSSSGSVWKVTELLYCFCLTKQPPSGLVCFLRYRRKHFSVLADQGQVRHIRPPELGDGEGSSLCKADIVQLPRFEKEKDF